MNSTTIKRIALQEVRRNSGGMKFIELVLKIAEYARIKGLDIPNPDLIEQSVRESYRLRVLDYTDTVINRAKMFIYTE